MGQKKNVDMSVSENEVKVVKAPQEPIIGEQEKNAATKQAASKDDKDKKPAQKSNKTVQKKERSHKYRAVRAQVDKTRHYDPFSAIELVKRLSYSSFAGTITAHLVLGEKFQGERVELELPHSTGQTTRVAIADDKLLKKIEAGELDFDVLLATPDVMPKLTKHAKVLGPQGLMPNPKQGTLTAKPEAKKKEIEAGKITINTERKAPLAHVVIGSTQMETKQLQENLQVLIDAFKNKLKRVTLAASMSPGVKVECKRDSDK